MTSLFEPALPYTNTVQIEGVVLFPSASKAIYITQKNTHLISNWTNDPFCDHFSYVGHKCSDSTVLRFKEKETISP